MDNQPPKTFISYSHDSPEHKEWVLKFATTLRDRGVDVILDQWELQAGDDLPMFMETNLSSADFAIMVCTSKYVAKANAGDGGVGYEKMIMTSNSLKDISDNKVIPVVLEQSESPVPTFLGSKLYIDFTENRNTEEALDELLRVLHRAPLYVKPEIGENPFKPLESVQPVRGMDNMRSVMRSVAEAYDRTSYDFVSTQGIKQCSNLRRITLDKFLREAVKVGYLSQGQTGIQGETFRLTDFGTDYLERLENFDAQQGIVPNP